MRATGRRRQLGDSLVVSSYNRTTGYTLLYMWAPAASWAPFLCQVGDSNAGDIAGQAPCVGNAGGSTVTIAATTSRLYVVKLGHAPGSASPVASVAWAYTTLLATAKGTLSGDGHAECKPKLLR